MKTHLRGRGLVVDRRDPVPADLAGGDHPDRRHPGLADRHLRGHGGAGLQPEQPLPVRPGAGHRHRRRRRDRRGRERRAQPAPGPLAQGRGAPDHGRGRRGAARHRARALRRVHPGRADLRHPGPVLPPVRGDHRGLDPDLLHRLADALAGPVRAAAQAARGAPQAVARSPPRSAGSSTASTGCSTGWPPATAGSPRRLVRLQRRGARGLCRADRARGLPVPARAHRLHPGAGPGLPHHGHPAAAGRLDGAHRQGRARGDASSRSSVEGTAHTARLRRLRRRHLHQRARTAAPSSSPSSRSRSGSRTAATTTDRSWPTCASSWRACRRRSSWSSTPPPVRGIGTGGGFKMYVEDRRGRGLQALEAATQELVGRANQEPGLASVFTLFNTRTPKVYADIDRAKAEMLGVPVQQRVRHAQRLSRLVLRQRLQLSGPHLPRAGAGRRPVPPRRARHRQPQDPERRAATWCRSARSRPSATSPAPTACRTTTSTPRPRCRGPRPRASRPARRSPPWSALASEVLPDGFGFEWTELAYQEKLAGNTAIYVFIASVVFVFLFLAAQYESWLLPLAVILIVPMCLLAAITGVLFRGPGQQHPGPDRPDRAGRPRRQERDPDRRVRASSARTRARPGSRPRSTPPGPACGRS